MPTHSPETPAPYYEGALQEVAHAHSVAVVTYVYTEDDGYSYDPDAGGEVEWLTEDVTSGALEEVNWDSDAGKRAVAEAVLGHHLKRAPTADEGEALLTSDLTARWQAGQEWTIEAAELDGLGLAA